MKVTLCAVTYYANVHVFLISKIFLGLIMFQQVRYLLGITLGKVGGIFENESKLTRRAHFWNFSHGNIRKMDLSITVWAVVRVNVY